METAGATEEAARDEEDQHEDRRRQRQPQPLSAAAPPPASPPSSCNRAAARQEIQSAWRERRQRMQQKSGAAGVASASSGRDQPARPQRSNRQPAAASPRASSKEKGVTTGKKHQYPPPKQQVANQAGSNMFPSFCSIACKAWGQHVAAHHRQAAAAASSSRQQQQKKKKSSPSTEPTASKPGGSSPPVAAACVGSRGNGGSSNNSHRRDAFPSVLSILQANALLRHVERNTTFLEQDDDERGREQQEPGTSVLAQLSKSGSEVSSPLPSSSNLRTSWSVFSSAYDFRMGLVEMARNRNRAFYMVDVATVVRRLVSLQETYPYVTLTHPVVQRPQLQRVFEGVGLVSDTAQDVANIVSQRDEGPDPSNLDNTLHTGKPDGYLRRFLSSPYSDKVVCVDGGEEMLRTVNTVKRLRRRRGQDVCCKGFILRLPDDFRGWSTALQDALTTLDRLNAAEVAPSRNYQLVGLSFDVDDTGGDVYRQRRQDMALKLTDQILSCHQEQCSNELEDEREQRPILRVDLTGFGSFPFDASWVHWWRELLRKHETAVQITVECSNLLLPPAGALCTRIIGVRETSTAASTKSADGSSTAEIIHRHYYIDDGCYGSLYQQPSVGEGRGEGETTTTNAFQPVPLLSPRQHQPAASAAIGRSASAAPKDDDGSIMNLSTVWGPTCDGLDRVCRDILLPRLQRDDWLVFFPTPADGSAQTSTNGNRKHGRCRRLDDNNHGTAFNGFEPPDTAYCVLGYFPKYYA